MTDHATNLALDIGGDDVGAAWLIARRSPQLSREQVARAARIEGLRDSTARQRKRADCSRRKQFALEMTRDERLDSRGDGADLLAERSDFASRLFGELGELAVGIAAGFSVEQTAEMCGVSAKTAYRRLESCRAKYGREFAGICDKI